MVVKIIMAISKQVFTAGNTATFAAALKTALDETGFFDSVTVTNLVVDCIKDEVTLLSFNLGVQSGGALVTVKNVNGASIGTIAYASVYGHAIIFPCSISTVGSAVMLIFSAQNSSCSTSIYIDSDTDGKVAIASMTNQEGARTGRTASTSSVAFDTAYGLSVPLSTTYTNASLYKVTAQISGGEIAVFENVFGIRFSPAMHPAITITEAGVTPSTIIINGTTYITDGYACIADT